MYIYFLCCYKSQSLFSKMDKLFQMKRMSSWMFVNLCGFPFIFVTVLFLFSSSLALLSVSSLTDWQATQIARGCFSKEFQKKKKIACSCVHQTCAVTGKTAVAAVDTRGKLLILRNKCCFVFLYVWEPYRTFTVLLMFMDELWGGLNVMYSV